MNKTYKIHTYGCQMNVHESEKIAAILKSLDFHEVEDNLADIVVFNTCCIRDTAEQKIFGHIGMYKKIKEEHPEIILVVVGCMSQQKGYDDIFKKSYSYVDVVLGTRNISDLHRILKEYLEENKRKRQFSQEMPQKYLSLDGEMGKYRTSFPNAWVNIIYGCNNFCTYCIVPYVRGREVSRPIQDIVEEVKQCLQEGYKEITLLGQNVNSYGNDLGRGTSFATLLKKLDELPYKYRLKYMTSHPKDLTDELINVMANAKNIAHCLHLPVQAGSNKVLQDMHRRYTREHYFSLVEKLRSKIPDIVLTTDIMVGFPTETEDDFRDTYNLVEQVKFNSVFAFIYSPRKGTPASEMPQLSYKVKQERVAKILKLQKQITTEMSKESIGEIHEILTDKFLATKDGYIAGKTFNGKIVSVPANGIKEGDFYNVRITYSTNTAMYGEII